MQRKLLGLALLISFTSLHLCAQELFPFTEPASNMPAKSIGVRLTNEGFLNPAFSSRTIPEVMIGFNKNLMGHVQAFFSDMDGSYRLEGASAYAKYRFLSVDDVQKHFRMSAFGRISTSKRKIDSQDINLEGDNSGWQAGFIATQLLHKLALSATLGYSETFNREQNGPPALYQPKLFSYSLSSGYLLLPFVYRDYNQPNFNIYAELLGKTDVKTGNSYLDLAPALQMIINSKTRIDLGYRFEMFGNIANRYNKNMYLVRVEFNFFNALN